MGAVEAAAVRMVVWCKAFQHQVEPDLAEYAGRIVLHSVFRRRSERNGHE